MADPIFISYATEDGGIAQAVCSNLEARALPCWIAPRDVSPGAEYGAEIVRAIESCRALVLVFSEYSNDSPYVRMEIERAVAKGKPILPLRIANILPTGSLEFFISSAQWIDATTAGLEGHVERLARAIQAAAASAVRPTASAAAPASAARRVFLCATPDELSGQRAAAEAMLRDIGWELLVRDPGGGSIEQSLRPLERADVVVAIVGWRRGPVPEPEAGGDGVRPWVQWEVSRALQRSQPLLVLMASEGWPAREQDPDARAAIADHRAELGMLAVPFDPEPAGVPVFEKLLFTELHRYRASLSKAPPSKPASKPASGLVLRPWPAPELPEQPWPVLLPYAHPDLLGGRNRELAELIERLGRPQPILALYAASGSGKSSLLTAGLVPALRAGGRGVALDRNPAEPGLAARLIGDLLDGPAEALAVDDADHATFVERLLTARRRAGGVPPVLVLDQLEDVLRGDRRARAVVGTLLAATAQRRPGVAGAPCRWLLAYRWEFHGELVHWLADPLREARALGFGGADGLPHDLASPDRFHAWSLPTLGTPAAGATDVAGAASVAFRAAITAPLDLRDEQGMARYPWQFEDGSAERLARAFGEARARQPEAPLAPELQVVLAHLVERAGEPLEGQPAVLRVPDDPGRLIDDALEAHLGRALDSAFPMSDRIGRTRALLALRELADASGQRGSVRGRDELARCIGREGRDVLEKLQAPRARLVVAEQHAGGLGYALSHDSLAEVIVRAVEGAGGRLSLDPGLLSLRRFVALQTELFHSGERRQATEVTAQHVAGIEAHADTLLAGDERRRWWHACLQRRRVDRRRRAVVTGLAAALLAIAGSATWAHVARRTAREALLAQVAQGEPEAALAALAAGLHDPAVSVEELRDRLRQRKQPLDVLESGMGGVPEARRGAVVLEVAELVLPLVGNALEKPAPLASLLWALDFAPGRDPALASRAASLREQALAPLRRLRHPPATEDAAWVGIPAGTFQMGSAPDEEGHDDERPAYSVTLSGFRALDHEVTNAEYRRLVAAQEGEDDHPAATVSWYSAYVYAAWLGGRLPTEAEWEYMARAGCHFQYCRQDGSEAIVADVAWIVTNSRASDKSRARPVRRLPSNPWGLHDVYGNLWEWAADWYGPYSAAVRAEPWGPTRGGGRVNRGGSFWDRAASARPALRNRVAPAYEDANLGFRPVLPASPNSRR